MDAEQGAAALGRVVDGAVEQRLGVALDGGERGLEPWPTLARNARCSPWARSRPAAMSLKAAATRRLAVAVDMDLCRQVAFADPAGGRDHAERGG